MRSTYTYALLDVSAETFREIRQKLEAAGYAHALHGDLIDMRGIALASPTLFEQCRCGHPRADHREGFAPKCLACERTQRQRVDAGLPGNFVDCYHTFQEAERDSGLAGGRAVPRRGAQSLLRSAAPPGAEAASSVAGEAEPIASTTGEAVVDFDAFRSGGR